MKLHLRFHHLCFYLHKKQLYKAAKGCDAIISVLNISRTSDFPWARLRTPRTFLSEVMQNSIEVSYQQGIQRVIVCSAWGVSETAFDIPFWFRWLINYSNIGKAYKDHERQEKLIMTTDLDWTIVRPVGLTNTLKQQNIQVSFKNEPTPKMTIGRRSVAEFMVRAVKDASLIRKLPVISAS